MVGYHAFPCEQLRAVRKESCSKEEMCFAAESLWLDKVQVLMLDTWPGVPGEGLGVSRESCCVPAVVTWVLTCSAQPKIVSLSCRRGVNACRYPDGREGIVDEQALSCRFQEKLHPGSMQVFRMLRPMVCSPLRYDGTVPSERGPNTLGRSAPYLRWAHVRQS